MLRMFEVLVTHNFPCKQCFKLTYAATTLGVASPSPHGLRVYPRPIALPTIASTSGNCRMFSNQALHTVPILLEWY